ncbi:P-loop containing nucleoside triphosphate hydrolase protein [Rhizoclosmatium globosum]|uniref:p-loop containing nucleoside triphosphate hydrolase protein n=1 Tax=Rhizoclosmatium globosum TaxID=329046 RepID=A0A1Y2BV07_9FUNG|nr:P-loop containing nucleoside triphosphate hydrolase protein [Rhizoclosmatium globosum]|eukprot:ORY38590.1 P-loop containing nucleoside triphosphate hydrolase protein [Rhizoclosmatium globosum]
MEDLPSLAKLDEPALLQDRFSDWFDKYGHAATPFQFLVAIVFTIQPAVFLNSFLHGILFLMCMFVDPLLLNQLLKLDDSFVQSMWLVGALSLICYYESTRVSNNVRTALALALFKYTVQSPPERVQNSAGLLTNLMATDTEKLGQFSWGVFALAQWVFAVLSLPFVIYFLHQLVGNGAFLGIAVLGFGIKAYLMIGEVLEAAQKRLQECRDERSKVMKQVLRAVKVTKLERLEEMWVVKLNEARNRELHQLRSVQYLSAFNNMAGALFSLCVPLSMFAWVTLVDGKELDTATAFSALAWIAQMQWSIISLPFIFNAWASLKPSLERIGTFLKSTTNLDSGNSRICSDSGHQFGEIHLKCKSNGLNASLNVEPGQLTVVIGATGSGKSRLLSSFVSPKEGDVSCVHGDVALVLQAPFLLNATVKENILFGLPFNEERLKDALQRTELVPDLEALPRGLMTMVGPSGVQLSGGQKARVCLARALYSDADCYLLDDILSAVDRTTGNRIWENVVAYLREKSKTVVLMTHQIQFLTRPEVDKVVLMDRGEVRAEGKFQELAYNKHIAACLEFLSQDDVSSESRPASTTIQVEAVVSRKHDQPLLTLQEVRDFLKPLLTSLAGKPITEAVINEQILSHFQSAKFDDSEMVETSQKGAITLSDFAYYFKHFGSIFGAVGILVSVAFIAAFTNIFSTVWMAFWTDSSTDPSEKYSQGTYLAVYGALGFVQAGIACLQAILLTWAALGASTSIHKEMVQKLLSAPLSYFDTHSSGLILNRFLQDLGSVDSSVPTTMLDQVGKSFSILGQFILICFYTPFVMFILPVVLAFYSYIINTFRIAARDTRRIESVARSPVYDLFGDVLNGIETIQCFAAQSRFEDWNKRLVGTMSAAKVGNEAVNKWAQALTVQVSCLFYFFAGFAGVVLFYGGVISMSTLGLVLLNAAVLQRALMDFVMGLTQVETNFVAVERVAEFTKMRSESNELRNVNDDTDERLKTGRLEICGLRMRYAINRSYVLNGIQLAIEPGLKVAVIGRTGCGKSSLLAALAQLYPPSDGSIQIDSVDVRTMSQQSLQKTLRVIPQETVLFDGSVRENILVGREMNDATIWKTLETVQLKGKVSAMGGLDAAVKFGGTEFSAGERQLLCLARALSSGIPKILLCDEVTSNVDLATDDLVLKALLGLDATVVMVMHRLESLRRFDKILMLQDGKVHVYGDANELIDNNVDVQRFMKQETH